MRAWLISFKNFSSVFCWVDSEIVIAFRNLETYRRKCSFSWAECYGVWIRITRLWLTKCYGSCLWLSKSYRSSCWLSKCYRASFWLSKDYRSSFWLSKCYRASFWLSKSYRTSIWLSKGYGTLLSYGYRSR